MELDQNGDILGIVDQERSGVNFPRDFNLSPDGKYMLIANQHGHDVILCTIDQENGTLTNTGKKLSMPAPVSIVFRY